MKIQPCEWGTPVPHRPQEDGLPEQVGVFSKLLAADLEAKAETFLETLVEPHLGQGVPCQAEERTNDSKSA